MSVLALTILAASQPAGAWEVLTNESGQELQWGFMPIEYRINAANDQGLSELSVNTAISDALGEWTGVEEANIIFDDLGATEIAATEYGDDNVIYFEPDWQYDDSLLALTANWSSTETGEILGFDIRINAEDHLWTVSGEDGRSDLQNMITHELGHALGLDHTTVDTTAAMFGTAVTGETVKRELKWDDKAGAGYLYGDATLPQTRGLGCSSAPSGGASMAGLLALAGLMLRRRAADPRGDRGA